MTSRDLRKILQRLMTRFVHLFLFGLHIWKTFFTSTSNSDFDLDQTLILQYPKENDSESTNKFPCRTLTGPSLPWNYCISEHWSLCRNFPPILRCVDSLAVLFTVAYLALAYTVYFSNS